MKLGLFGGTFNPIHNGHIKVICHVKQKFGLNEIYVIPSALPPHKPDINLAAANDRLKMVRCAIKNIPGLTASDIEIKRTGPSFTIDTINQLQKNISCHSAAIKTELYLIMGSDAFFDIPTWKKTIEIFSQVPVIVMIRAGEKRNINNLASLIKDMISDKYYYDRNSNAFQNPGMKTIYIHKVPDIAISSTMIRKRVQNHLSISSMVQPCVEKIIKEKGLYL